MKNSAAKPHNWDTGVSSLEPCLLETCTVSFLDDGLMGVLLQFTDGIQCYTICSTSENLFELFGQMVDVHTRAYHNSL